MLLLFYLTSGWIVISAALDKPFYKLDEAEALFEDFARTYGKSYPNQSEKQQRLEIFIQNLQIINQMNFHDGAVFGINYFTDLTQEEVRSQYMCLNTQISSNNTQSECSIVTDNDVVVGEAPQSLNWVTKGAVTPVKNQLSCGSCWAFGTVGNIEGQYFLKFNQLKSFSEQELVDCSESNNGCQGGFMSLALTDLIHLDGVQEEATYPYEATQNQCRLDKSKIVAKIVGCTSYNMRDEDKFKEIVAKTGPIVIGLNADGLASYTNGILTLQQCAPTVINHAVLLVGYGTDENGVDYWLVKNSWGAQWGEQGYFRLKRNDNVCGFMNDYSCSGQVSMS